MVPETRFTLLSYARSGTTFAIDLLNQHPDVYAHLEIFAGENAEKRLRDEYKEKFGIQDVHADPLGFLKKVLSFTPGQKCVGFKMWPNQSQEAYDAVLQDPSIHKIVLQRTNYLASLSSSEMAKATGVSHIATDKKQEIFDRIERPVLRFDPERLKQYSRSKRFGFLRTLESSVGPTLNTTYLSLVENGPGEIFDFLDLPPHEAKGRLRKVNTANILERYDPEDHALIIETLDEMGVPEWVDESQDSHVVTLEDREAVKAAKRAKKRGQESEMELPKWLGVYDV